MPASAVICPSCKAALTLEGPHPAGMTHARCPNCSDVVLLHLPTATGAEADYTAALNHAAETSSSAVVVIESRVAPSDEPKTSAAPTGSFPSLRQFAFLAPPEQPDEIGRLGTYRVLQLLGQGGMGAVFLAEDPTLRRRLALKVMLPQHAASEQARTRFLREARAQAAVEHDHVVTIHQVGEDRDIPFLAMPLLKGQSLGDALKANSVIPVAEAVRIARETAEGLAAAHEQHMVHRDVKPGNLWLEGARRRVKVLDFGLARPAGGASEGGGLEPMTQTGVVVGTPAYMSPEQARGERVDARTDLFSLGCVLYQMLTGRQPFIAQSVTGVLIAVATENPPRPVSLNPSIPPELDNLVMRLLEKNPAGRPQSAAALVEELRMVEAGLGVTGMVLTPIDPIPTGVADPWESIDTTEQELIPLAAPAEASQRRKPRRWVWAGLVVAFLAVGAVAADVIIKIRNKDGTETEIKVPRGATVEVAKDGKTVATVGPSMGTAQAAPAGGTWKPVPVGQSPFDKLDAQEIPKEERFDYQPKELVAVIGSHARRHWNFVNSIAITTDSKLAATRASCVDDSLIVWDMATETPKWRLQPFGGDYNDGSLHFIPNGHQLLCFTGGGLTEYDLTGPEPVAARYTIADKPDGKTVFDWRQMTLCESGRTLVAMGPDERFGLFDLSEGKPRLVELRVVAKKNLRVLVAADADQLVYIALDGKLHRATIKSAKLVSDEELPVTIGEKEYLRALSPDGKRLALWSGDHLQLWELSQKPLKLVQKIGQQTAIHWDSGYYFSPDGRWLAGKYSSTALFRIDGAEPKFAGWLDQTDRSGGGSVAFSPDGNHAVVGNGEGFVRFWDLSGAEPKELAPFDPNTAFLPPWGLVSVAIDPVHGRLMLPRYDRPRGKNCRYECWALTGTKPEPIPGPGRFLDPETCGPVCFAGTDRWLQITTGDFGGRRSRLYSLLEGHWQPAGKPFGEPNPHGNLSPNGTLLVTYATSSNAIPNRLDGWDLTANSPIQKWAVPLTDHPAQLLEASCRVWFSADGRWFATQAQGDKPDGPQKLVVWRNTGPKPEVAAVMALPWPCVAFAHDGRALAYTINDGQMVIVDLTGKEPRESVRFTVGAIRSLAFHPDGKKLACGRISGVSVVDIATGKPLWRWEAPGTVDWLDWAADGRHLVTHNSNKTTYVLRLKKLTEPKVSTKDVREPVADGWVDVLALDEAWADTPYGDGWDKKNGRWTSGMTPGTYSELGLPLTTNGSYDLEAEATLERGSDCLAFLLPIGDASVSCGFNHYGGTRAGLYIAQGEAWMPHDTIQAGRRFKVTLSVRVKGEQAEIAATADGIKPIHWSGPVANLSRDAAWQTQTPSSRFGIVTYGSRYTMHTLRFKKIDGTAEIIKRIPVAPSIPAAAKGPDQTPVK